MSHAETQRRGGRRWYRAVPDEGALSGAYRKDAAARLLNQPGNTSLASRGPVSLQWLARFTFASCHNARVCLFDARRVYLPAIPACRLANRLLRKFIRRLEHEENQKALFRYFGRSSLRLQDSACCHFHLTAYTLMPGQIRPCRIGDEDLDWTLNYSGEVVGGTGDIAKGASR